MIRLLSSPPILLPPASASLWNSSSSSSSLSNGNLFTNTRRNVVEVGVEGLCSGCLLASFASYGGRRQSVSQLAFGTPWTLRIPTPLPLNSLLSSGAPNWPLWTFPFLQEIMIPSLHISFKFLVLPPAALFPSTFPLSLAATIYSLALSLLSNPSGF